MNEQQAREILGEDITEDGISNSFNYVYYEKGDNCITLDGGFGEDYLEALVWWMKNMKNMKDHCEVCHGTGKVEIQENLIDQPDLVFERVCSCQID